MPNDVMDIIHMQQSFGDRTNRYPIIDEYPETVQNVLWSFVSTWGIPEASIPRKPKGGKGDYARWIEELGIIESLCGGEYDFLIRESLSHYIKMNRNFPVVRPLAVKTLIIEVLSERNRTKKVQEQKRPRKSFSEFMDEYEGKIPENNASKSDMLKTVRDLKSLIKDDTDASNI